MYTCSNCQQAIKSGFIFCEACDFKAKEAHICFSAKEQALIIRARRSQPNMYIVAYHDGSGLLNRTLFVGAFPKGHSKLTDEKYPEFLEDTGLSDSIVYPPLM